MKNKRKNANIKSVKNALCIIEDDATKLFCKLDNIKYREEILKIRIHIDKCIWMLERLLKE